MKSSINNPKANPISDIKYLTHRGYKLKIKSQYPSKNLIIKYLRSKFIETETGKLKKNYEEIFNGSFKEIFTFDNKNFLIHLNDLEYLYVASLVSRFITKNKITKYCTNTNQDLPYAIDEKDNCYLLHYEKLIPNVTENMEKIGCLNPYTLYFKNISFYKPYDFEILHLNLDKQKGK